MPQDPHRSPFGLAAWPLRLAFVTIILSLALINLLGFLSARHVQEANRAIVENMLTSIELVSRIRHDLDKKRLLLDAHIYEKEAVDMDRVELQIADVDADFVVAARAYDALATLPDERETWNRLTATAADLRGPIQRVLDLSRRNLDDEARVELAGMQGRLDAVDRSAASLIDANHAGADQAVAEVGARQRTFLAYLLGLASAGIVLSTIIAIWITGFVGRGADKMASLARQLEERNRELDAFAGRVAHDLRGPLARIDLAASLVAERAPQEEVSTGVLRRGVARMEMLIDDLLKLSRLSAQPTDVTCDPSKVAAQVADEVQARIREDGGTIVVDVEPALAQCGEGLLRQALGNLVDNAVKYRRADAPLELGVRGHVAAGRYELAISDTGIGMSGEDIRHVFEPFYRAAQVRDRPGTGLGLSIVKRIVDTTGGTISVASEAGRGTTFTIKLPAAPAMSAR